MKRMLLLVTALLSGAAAALAAGQQSVADAPAASATEAAAAPQKSAKTAALVDASRSAKSKRRASKTRVITNADVKKSKGTLIENKAAATPIEPAPEELTIEKHEANKRASAAADAAYRDAQSRVVALEKELLAVEQRYYEENDLDRRDSVIAREFDDVRARLVAARAALEALAPATETPQS